MRRFACLLLVVCLLPACEENPPAVKRDRSLDQAEKALKNQDYDAALRHLGKAIEIEPQQPYLQLRRGDVLFLSSRYPEALDAYDMAYQLNKQSAEAALGAGLSLAMMGQEADAMGKYEIAERLFEQRLNQPPDTEQFSEQYIEQATIHAKLHLAMITALRGQKAGALRQVDMIAEAHPGWDEADAWRAMVEDDALAMMIAGR